MGAHPEFAHMTNPLASFGRTTDLNLAYVEQWLDENYYTDRGL